MTKRLLVVDDDDALREVIQACLEELGHWEAIAAKSGSEGLHKIDVEPIDAVLLDVSMPDMDGVCFFNLLQANPITQTIPVVLLTAKVLPDDRAKFAQLGVAGVITKPFHPATLCDRITEILGW